MARSGLTSAALAFIVVVLMVASVVGVMTAQSVLTPGTTTGQRTSRTSTVSTSAEEGLQLNLGAAPSAVDFGGSITVSLSDYNTQGMTNSPTMVGLPMIGGASLGLGPCSQLPLGLGIAKGYYGAANISQASILNLFQPGIYFCPAEFAVAYFSFSPLSDDVSLYSPQPSGSGNATVPTLMWTQHDAFSQNFTGYWIGQGFSQGNDTFHSFQPGVYTIVGADAFGQLAVVHFAVQAASSEGKSVTAVSLHGLELLAALNATEIVPGETVQVNLSEFNTLQTVNNVSASDNWSAQVSLGPCRNIYDQPFGIAVYYGHVDEQNLSQGKQVDIFPIVACPLYIRLVTGYEFQPQSDLAVILPSFGTVPSPLVGSVDVGMVYGSQPGQPLPAGTYTVVAGDEWGALAFLYFQVN
jgi:hypothetical protein